MYVRSPGPRVSGGGGVSGGGRSGGRAGREQPEETLRRVGGDTIPQALRVRRVWQYGKVKKERKLLFSNYQHS